MINLEEAMIQLEKGASELSTAYSLLSIAKSLESLVKFWASPRIIIYDMRVDSEEIAKAVWDAPLPSPNG